MSTPGDPFESSLRIGFGQRDPYFRPAKVFSGEDERVDEIHECLARTGEAWNKIKVELDIIGEEAKRLDALFEGVRNRRLTEAGDVILQAAYQVHEARKLALYGYDRAYSYLQDPRRR